MATLVDGSSAYLADLIWPATGVIGRIVLLSGALFSGTAVADPGTNLITTGLPHGLATGSRFSLAGTLPSGLDSPDLWAIVTSPTTFRVAGDLAEAQSNAFLPLGSTGSGLVVTEKALELSDSIPVLIKKEVTAFARQPLSDVGTANASGIKPVAINYTNIGSSFTYRHILITRGGSATAGDVTGIDFAMLESAAIEQVIGAGDSKLLQLSLGAV
jgi:hypothetical protein